VSGAEKLTPRARSIARKLAMQALYQWQLTQQPAEVIEQQFFEAEDFKTADAGYFVEVLASCIAKHAELDQAIAQFVDRPVEQLDPVEHAILLLGIYELQALLDVPYKVVINEAVSLAKRFGATDGHKFINAILDKAANLYRRAERQV
jgi:N utilization substance protein B